MKINKQNLFNIIQKMPQELTFLDVLKENIWWCWQHDAVKLLSSIDPTLWKKSGNSLKLFLNNIPQEKIETLAKDKRFIAKLKQIEELYDKQVGSKQLHSKGDIANRKLAYFSLEYGIHESLRLYSGGLGVLSGDHSKAASDLAVPLVAVGLLYQKGYFVQQLNKEGWQTEQYPDNTFQEMPIKRAKDDNGNDLHVSVKLMDQELTLAVWLLNVGNIPLVLLDSNLQENPEHLRDTTARLYGGDKRMRLHQELV